MVTFEQFKQEWREKEAREGNKLEISNRQIVERAPLSEAELQEMYKAHTSAQGIQHHGEFIGGTSVLELKDVSPS